VAFALLVHGLIFLAIIASASGSQIALGAGAGVGDKEAYVVSLEGLSGSSLPFARRRQQPQPQRQDERMAALFHKLTNADTPSQPTPTAPSRSNSKLIDLFSPQPTENQPSDTHGDGKQRGDNGEGADHGNGKGGQHTPDAVKVAEVGAGDGVPSGGTFPGQVERCWRKLPGHAAVPVVLEVTLNNRGLIAAPPRIIRPSGAQLDERRLISEERAIRALASCVPYRGASGDQTFRLSFHTG
jgi:hypothetical protein